LGSDDAALSSCGNRVSNVRCAKLSSGAIVVIIPGPEVFMSQAAEALSAQAAKLPPEERVIVVDRILDGLDQPNITLDTLWAKEGDDWLAGYRRGENKALPLADAIAKY